MLALSLEGIDCNVNAKVSVSRHPHQHALLGRLTSDRARQMETKSQTAMVSGVTQSKAYLNCFLTFLYIYI